METLGWVGSFLLAFCGLPSAYQAWKHKKSTVPWGLLIPWYLGEILVLIPIVFQIKSWYLIFNYAANVLFISIIIYYKNKGKKVSE